MTGWQGAIGLLLLVPAGAAQSHPHIFIDSGLEVIFDAQGAAVAVKVTWSYDDFYSMVMIEDRGLDADFDGLLTAAETTALTGFDMAWDEDFNGDLYVLSGGQPVGAGRPEAFEARYEDGRITTAHLRRFERPVQPGDDGLILQVYDAGYYTAYEITRPPVLTNAPAGCVAQVFEPDRYAADATLQAALKEYSGDPMAEVQFPAVGAAYADEVRVICPGR